MKKVKYINIKEFVEKHGNKAVSAIDLLEELKNAPAADVISTDFISRWFEEHYGTHVNPIRDAWRKENE